MSQVVRLSTADDTGLASTMEIDACERDGASVMEACLRVMRVALKTIVAKSEDFNGLEAPVVRTLLHEFGLVHEDEVSIDEQQVHSRLDARLTECSTMRRRLGTPLGDIANGLAGIFEYDPPTRDLLELALHANRCKPLRRVLNLFKDVDEDDAAEFFALVLGYDPETMAEALRRHIPFRNHEPFDIGFCRANSLFFYLEFNRAAAKVLRGQPTLERMLSLFFRLGEKAKLGIEDFAHQGMEVELLVQYTKQAMRTGRKGANVLLYGAPGTGKTELVRTLAEAIQANLVEVPTVDEDKDPLPHWKRLTALTAAQDILRAQASSLVLFDEVEDVFPVDSPFGRVGRSGKGGDRHKGWLVRMLEENERPTFWVCNEIDHIDPAYLRRFDFVMELLMPKAQARARIVDKAFAGSTIGQERLSLLKTDTDLAPGHLERMGGVLRMLEPSCPTSAEIMLDILDRNTRRALNLPTRNPAGTQCLPYRMECINADVDLAELAHSITEVPAVRVCLYGPPGTGKTEWARQLATRIDRPLHVRRASDLLGRYVGESEQQIRHAFEGAAREGAVLLVDEADSLLHDRSKAQHAWEVSMVNEMLTCMESFNGIFIASTNLQDRLDEASARRFDFKVKLGYLTQAGVRRLFADLLAALELAGQPLDDAGLGRLTALAPGDFTNVYRQARVMQELRSPDTLMAMLLKEQKGRCGTHTMKFGFI